MVPQPIPYSILKIWPKKNILINLNFHEFPEFAVIFIGKSPGNIDIIGSNLKKSMGNILAGIIMEHSGIENFTPNGVRF